MTQDQDSTAPLVAIYALCDPETGDVRYIGQSRDPAGRLRGHLSERGVPGVHGAWLQALHQRALKPVLRVLAMVPQAQAADAERRQIALHCARGCDLTNIRYNPAQSPRQAGRQTATGDVWISVRLPRPVLAQIKARLGRDGPSISWIVRKMLIEATQDNPLNA